MHFCRPFTVTIRLSGNVSFFLAAASAANENFCSFNARDSQPPFSGMLRMRFTSAPSCQACRITAGLQEMPGTSQPLNSPSVRRRSMRTDGQDRVDGLRDGRSAEWIYNQEFLSGILVAS
jgi:hypothetical protein